MCTNIVSVDYIKACWVVSQLVITSNEKVFPLCCKGNKHSTFCTMPNMSAGQNAYVLLLIHKSVWIFYNPSISGFYNIFSIIFVFIVHPCVRTFFLCLFLSDVLYTSSIFVFNLHIFIVIPLICYSFVCRCRLIFEYYHRWHLVGLFLHVC